MFFGGAVLGSAVRIEQTQVRALRLFLRPPLHQACTLAPQLDDAIGIDDEDGILPHIVDEGGAEEVRNPVLLGGRFAPAPGLFPFESLCRLSGGRVCRRRWIVSRACRPSRVISLSLHFLPRELLISGHFRPSARRPRGSPIAQVREDITPLWDLYEAAFATDDRQARRRWEHSPETSARTAAVSQEGEVNSGTEIVHRKRHLNRLDAGHES